jgi:hypothetical protein
MNKDADRPSLSRPLHVDELAKTANNEGASGEITATKDEMAAISTLLDLVALDTLAFAYRLRHGGSGRLHLSGRLTADVTQTCVVSLDRVETRLDVPVEAEFWPASLIEALSRNADSAGSPDEFDWPEPIVDGKIDLGPLVYESLVMALDPYPKREGARFEWPQGESPDGGGEGPFAALGALKRR